MKNKRISIIEIISIIIIIIALVTLIRPLIIKVSDNKKQRDYISNVNVFVDKAVDMYKQEKYRNDNSYFTKINGGYIISLDKLEDLDLDKDPYGYEYKKNESFIIFKDKNEEVIVNIKSCMMDSDIEKCYEIANVNVKDLDVQSIKTSLN